MATNASGRMGSRSRTNSWSSSSSSGSTGMGWGSRSTSSKRKTSGGHTGSGAASGYKSCCTAFNNKIQSFKTLMGQTTGAARHTRPSTGTLNSFANWINKGAIIQTVSTAQVSRWAKACRKNFTSRSATPTTCKTVLCAKFGKTAIKAVARTKTGSFMIATTPTINGKQFCFPK